MKRDDFLLLLQTALLSARELSPVAMFAVLADAVELPEDALPSDSRHAAKTFASWKFGGPKPDWIVEHEQNVRDRVRIKINQDLYAGATDTWWLHAERLGEDLPESVVEMVYGRAREIVVSRADAEAFETWAKGIPGYFDGPPFIFEAVTA